MNRSETYTITITRNTKVTATERGEYGVIGERLLTEEEVKSSFFRTIDPAEIIKTGKILKSEYGYAPEVEKTRVYPEPIYTQTVETLDLSAVISAINNLKS